MMAAKSYGIKTVFTEHSLFTFNDPSGIHINKLVKWTFRDLDAAICVSNACKDNFVLRAKFDPKKTFTIPNAVDFNRFTPNTALRDADVAKSGNPNLINIVYISRLAYRKGVDLLIPIIPKILAQFDNVNFIIGGDGPAMNNLKGLIEKHNLHSRVELLGGLRPDKVRDVLCRGHIFLNTSLTESFCIAILEAACCGLLVVTTDVGGVPEVLPPHMAYLAKPEEKSIIRQLNKAVKDCKEKDIPTHNFNRELSQIYNWRQVAERTEKVYDFVCETPTPNILDRIKTAYTWGPLVGVYGIMYTILEAITLMITEIMFPIRDIDVARSFSTEKYNANLPRYGDHELYVDNTDSRQKKAENKVIDQQYSSEVTLPKAFKR
jgi:phosphatidylinositol glycan class A protein